jgi:hypothetical protein
MISHRQFSQIFSSAVENGAINKSADGTVFSVSLDQAISFPSDAFNMTCEVQSGTLWNSVNNISATLNNNKFYYFNGANTTLYTVTLPDGLYSVSSLNAEVNKSLVNQGLVSGVVSITGNQSTQRIVLSFNILGSYVNFAQPNTCRGVLGFNARLAPLAPTTIIGQSADGDTTAKFNNIESFLLKTDLVYGDIPTNNVSDQTIAQIDITARTNEQIVYQPINPIRVDASNLKGQGRNYATFRLTDEKGFPAQTNEDWAFLLLFRYSIHQPIVINKSV